MGEILFLLAWVIFIIVYFVTTASLPAEAKHFPYFLLVLMCICIVYLLFRAVKNYVTGKKEAAAQPAEALTPEAAEKKRQNRRITFILGFVVVLSAVYAALWRMIGFELSTLLYLFASMMILGVKWLKAALISAGTTVGLYLVFVFLLKMNLPVLFWF